MSAPQPGAHPSTPDTIGPVGRTIYGPTPPGGASPCLRTTPLNSKEFDEVVALVAAARQQRRCLELPVRLQTRDWDTITRIVLALDSRRGLTPVGWKIGAASEVVRRAEGVPYPSPGRIYAGTVFDSGATLPPDLFMNYRNNECEFAFTMGRDLVPRAQIYEESEVVQAIESLSLAIEIGDTVFPDWYGASAYLGSSLDNGGGAALVRGAPIRQWQGVDLAGARIDLYLNDTWVKTGSGAAAMGHPVTSLTWLVNWLSSRDISLTAGEIVSTGTCTGHCFAAREDRVRAVFAGLGEVEFNYG